MSAAAKFVVASLEVKVTVSVASLVVAPSLTALEPSVAVMAMVGAVVSRFQIKVPDIGDSTLQLALEYSLYCCLR